MIRTLCMGLLSLTCVCIPPSNAAPADSDSLGRIGFDHGGFIGPRGVTVDQNDPLSIVDATSPIQMFDTDGRWLGSWKRPECRQGQPAGLSWNRKNLLMVCDTYHFPVPFDTLDGPLLPERTIGRENGQSPCQFSFTTDFGRNSASNYQGGEYGVDARIQKLDPAGQSVMQLGNGGSDPEEFFQSRNLAIDHRDWLWVASASKHQLRAFEIFRDDSALTQVIGGPGSVPTRFYHPFQFWMDEDNDRVWGCDLGNDRIRALSPEGVFIKSFGSAADEPDQFYQLWSLAQDRRKNLFVLDTCNHRVQPFRTPGKR